MDAVNQGLATLAFFGVGVNLVLFLTRVLGQDNASAANNVSKWTGTVYIFSLLGAFLSDSYWGRYFTCAVFQSIFVLVSPIPSHSINVPLMGVNFDFSAWSKIWFFSLIEQSILVSSIHHVLYMSYHTGRGINVAAATPCDIKLPLNWKQFEPWTTL